MFQLKDHQYKLWGRLCYSFMSRCEIHKCVRTTHQQCVLTVVADRVSLIVDINATRFL